ncbi:MAG: LPS assembly lipoprotein LptE [Burkholderiaceae bacterium]|nr:LPS assembly lipoprotein LptE [Burkholderiaceae bacterium]MCD8517607.1 LPS assembly lipoprotein LptE [Burkholderiaceae bacterium]MCD8537402.1 LPS assembly lipoprotein LptE [Burkholderiaceae bacterium]MCD8565559.1 LPS assembly lipoprotein LptE [Burkholderiaceae bacterium]
MQLTCSLSTDSKTPKTASRGWWLLLLATLALTLTACGFRMQGTTPLPFKSLLMKVPENTAFGADLRRAIKAASPNTALLESASSSYDAALQQISTSRTAREVSLNAQGRVEEYELTLTYTFNLVTANGEVILPNTTLRAVRNMPFDDRVVQAKEGEQATLFNQMQSSLVSRIVRQISAPDVAERYAELKANGN